MINLQIQVDERTLKAIDELAQCHTNGDVRQMAGLLLREQVTPCDWQLNLKTKSEQTLNKEQKGNP